ncbi:MAG: hypothetical protein ABS36_12095 [Acidobacteria bacterium SCN 69-37]|nr:MAG: hypothetical protein ABS36_12095 [Acidobacteria bacterium SCN 69-37]
MLAFPPLTGAASAAGAAARPPKGAGQAAPANDAASFLDTLAAFGAPVDAGTPSDDGVPASADAPDDPDADAAAADDEVAAAAARVVPVPAFPESSAGGLPEPRGVSREESSLGLKPQGSDGREPLQGSDGREALQGFDGREPRQSSEGLEQPQGAGWLGQTPDAERPAPPQGVDSPERSRGADTSASVQGASLPEPRGVSRGEASLGLKPQGSDGREPLPQGSEGLEEPQGAAWRGQSPDAERLGQAQGLDVADRRQSADAPAPVQGARLSDLRGVSRGEDSLGLKPQGPEGPGQPQGSDGRELPQGSERFDQPQAAARLGQSPAAERLGQAQDADATGSPQGLDVADRRQSADAPASTQGAPPSGRRGVSRGEDSPGLTPQGSEQLEQPQGSRGGFGVSRNSDRHDVPPSPPSGRPSSEGGDGAPGFNLGAHAAPRLAPPAPAAPVTSFASFVPADALPSDTSGQIVQAIRLQILRNGGEAHIRLDPRQFGDVTVRVSVEQGQVTARVEADAPVVREWLQGHQHLLRQNLAGQQLTLDRLEVHEPPASADRDRQDDGTSRDGQQGEPRQPRRRRPDSGGRFEVVA